MLRLASESHVRMTIVVQVESLVVLMENALHLVLERRAIVLQIAQRMKLVVIALRLQVNVPLLVLENRVNMIHTAQLMNIVVAILLAFYANVRNHALVYRAHTTVNVDQAKVVVRTKNAL